MVRNSSPVSDALKEEGIEFETLDFLYEKSRNFDTLAKNIVKEVKKYPDVCYCVEGGVTEDRAAQLLIKGGAQVIEGVSKAADAAARAGLCGAYTAVSAYEIGDAEITFPLVVYDLTDAEIASDVKLRLFEVCGDETPVLFLNRDEIKEIPLYEADRQEDYTSCALVVKAIPLLEKKRFTFADCVAILKRLRAPDGCPWDRVQTHESIRINALEEAYELVDAIDRKDSERMCEEAGDVLMQALFHTLIEEERGGFSVGDMLSGLCEKLIGRHTHVFGNDHATGADGALSVWDKNKMKEKGQATFSDSVNDVPECFPALLRAQKIVKRMQKGGWRTGTFDEIAARLQENVAGLKAAYEKGDEAAIREEMGDILVIVVQLGRAVGADCEQALLDTVKRSQRLYTAWEKLVIADGKQADGLSEEEWIRYYVLAKRETDNV